MLILSVSVSKTSDAQEGFRMAREALIKRKTKETDIEIRLNLDGTGKASVSTGIGFFDHMLEGFARHGFFDLTVSCTGDLHVDSHHTIEDVGIVLGDAIREALGDKSGIARFGYMILPMDETLMTCAVDLSGRPYLVFDTHFSGERCGGYDTAMAEEFFYAVSIHAGMNLHFVQMKGSNDHHILEACYKAFAKALDMAVRYDERVTGVLSTKGSL